MCDGGPESTILGYRCVKLEGIVIAYQVRKVRHHFGADTHLSARLAAHEALDAQSIDSLSCFSSSSNARERALITVGGFPA
jgi:hypothetical protein